MYVSAGWSCLSVSFRDHDVGAKEHTLLGRLDGQQGQDGDRVDRDVQESRAESLLGEKHEDLCGLPKWQYPDRAVGSDKEDIIGTAENI